MVDSSGKPAEIVVCISPSSRTVGELADVGDLLILAEFFT